MHIRKFQTLTLLCVAALLIVGSACSSKKADLNQTLRENFQTPSNAPVLLAAYQPWFGRPGHINVGYNSQDPVLQQKQIQHAKNLGIEAFVVNWYGGSHSFEDHAYATMQQTALENQFQTAIMYDEASDDPQNSTSYVIDDLKYAYDHYIAANAPTQRAYLRFNGHPLIFIFPKGTFTDWNKVKQTVQQWDGQPLLIYKDIPKKYAGDFDGFYAWVNPGPHGWQHDGSNWGEEYLKEFYLRMNNEFPNKIAIGAAWPGFNDTKASWSRNRKMDARCGKTFEESLRLFRRYYPPERPLPYLMIDTWNDYEEGTAIEPGLANCRGESPQMAGATN
ncbi:hypothetical protein Acid345_2683 [Candidatus Koribacter versatilis Ellin345]|uniref:GH26 domain-containing protein n=1 Tax=Koribacter versatilis (strain Ellin345) TaxID=204669 RepID=Q1IN66_KORVE|nr:hypothetical protein [Candidatus Koribacter versatilis]ABF41684.1 hypothetical protein Acid345_2683 [Candidatus Koribacter versatilis Ellin345]